MNILDFCESPRSSILNLDNKSLEVLKSNLIGILKNNQGGWNIMTSLPTSQLEVFRKKGQGLYAWVTQSQYNLMLLDPTKLYPIKFGQFGTNSKFGTTPQLTIDSYTWINEPVVILWVLHFGKDELEVGTPYEIEQKVNIRIGEQVINGKGKETFMTSLDIIIKEVSSELYKDGDRIFTFSPRKRQQHFIDKFISHRLNGGSQL